jgi:hypothetical protein
MTLDHCLKFFQTNHVAPMKLPLDVRNLAMSFSLKVHHTHQMHHRANF